MTIPKKRKTVGLALGSGGIKGLAHIGVIQTLIKHRIPIDYVAGTSAGALIGAYFAAYNEIDLLEKFLAKNKNQIINAIFEPSLAGGLIKGAKVEKIITTLLGDITFDKTKIPFRTVATDLLTGQPVVFSKGKIIPALRASIAVPSIFKPIEYEGKILIDGGITDNVPVDIVKDMGAEIVIAVNLDNNKRPGTYNANEITITSVLNRGFDILLHNQAVRLLKDADVVIEPKNSFFEFASLRNYLMKSVELENFQKGKEATEEVMRKIQKLIN